MASTENDDGTSMVGGAKWLEGLVQKGLVQMLLRVRTSLYQKVFFGIILYFS